MLSKSGRIYTPIESIVKASSINMGFNLFGNYFFRELGDVVWVGDRAVVFKVVYE